MSIVQATGLAHLRTDSQADRKIVVSGHVNENISTHQRSNLPSNRKTGRNTDKNRQIQTDRQTGKGRQTNKDKTDRQRHTDIRLTDRQKKDTQTKTDRLNTYFPY